MVIGCDLDISSTKLFFKLRNATFVNNGGLLTGD
jgi:hypothetical protein